MKNFAISRVAAAFLMMGLFLLGPAPNLLAQNAASGDLRGYIRDPQGAAIPNATVLVEDPNRGFSRTVTTDGAGFYQVLLLPPGDYTVTASAPGFGKLINRGVNVTTGQNADLALTLKIASATEEVTVNANAEIIETEKSAQSTTVDEQRIENLPINGRNYINFTLTNSQVTRDAAPSVGAIPTTGLNFGGARARSNAVNIDGADNTDYIGNGNRSTLSQEAVQEFQILTNSFPAEYGRASGGVVNIVSKSGANDLHGSAFGFLRNRNIQATNPFSTVKDPAYTRVQAGFTIGGSILKDRTFYFFGTEITRREETGFSDIGNNNFGLVNIDASKFFGAPPGALTIQGTPQQAAFLNSVPAAIAPRFEKYAALIGSSSSLAVNGANPAFLAPIFGPKNFSTSGAATPASFVPLQSLIGNFPISEKTEVYSLRIDHKLTQSQQLFVRANVSPSTITGIEENAANQNFGENSASRTAQQRFHDFSLVGQHTWVLTPSQVNELRIQYSRHPIEFANANSTGGSGVAVNIPGFSYFGKTPYSVIDRIEKQVQVQDNYTLVHGGHSFKFGVDGRYIPINFKQGQLYSGGDYSFGTLSAGSLNAQLQGLPDFSPVQAYGLGIPQSFVQSVGLTSLRLSLKTIGAYAQDSWKISPKLTANYGLRYDVTGYPVHTPINANSTAAEKAFGVGEGFPTRLNNFAPRLGLAFDPHGDGRTVIRGSYGIYFDRIPGSLELQAIKFNTNDIPIVILAGGNPCPIAGGAASPTNLNATNTFQGTLGNANCIGAAASAGLGYLAGEQRFIANNNNSLFTNQNYLAAGFPLAILPSGLPSDSHFSTPYAIQGSFGVERDLGHNMSLNVAYTFNGGRHLNRPINADPVSPQFLLNNWERANAAVQAGTAGVFPGTPQSAVSGLNVNPLTVATAAGTIPCGFGPAGPYIAPPVVNFFRRAGLNTSLSNALTAVGAGQCVALAQQIIAADGLGVGVPVNFSDVTPNRTNGTSNYNALSVNLRKRFSTHYEYLASYTWSHAIDDSTDVVSVSEGPQSEFAANAERANSSFDQRNRFVLSGIYNSERVAGDGFVSKAFSHITVAPIIELSSGRPFNILTGVDTNFNFTPLTDRPSVVAGTSTPNNCGTTPVASKYSPSGFLNLPCLIDDNPFDGTFNGNVNGTLGRNAGTRPYVVFTDLRLGKAINFTDRVHLDLLADGFNLINKFNVLDVNLLFDQAGKPTAAYDPRQFQFGARLSF